MANTAQMILKVQRLCGNHKLATYDDVLGAINSRHSDLLESFDWSRKKTSILLTAVPDKSDGTLAVNNGSATVHGTGTTFTQSNVGSSIKIGSDTSSIYTVKTVTTAMQLSLGDDNGSPVGYAGDSNPSSNYVLFKRIYSLGRGVEQIRSVQGKVPLTEVSEEYLDSLDPGRMISGSDPIYFARVQRNMTGTNDIAQIEFYPRPSIPQVITVKIQKGHVDLLPSQNPIVPSGPLQWFAAVDICYELFNRTKEEKWLVSAAKFNQEGSKSLEFEKNEDWKKFGVNSTVQDVTGDIPLGMTDYGITHDFGD